MSDQTFTKAELEAAITDAKTALDTKNRELLAELKEARKSATITPEQLASVEAERDELRGKLTAAEKSVKDAIKVAETATKALEGEQGFTQRLLIDNGLTEALTAAGVKEAPHLKAVKAMMASQVQVVADGDARTAKVGDKALADFVKEWAASDEGKYFVSAPNNGGGGAPGGKGGAAGAKTMPRAQFDALDPVARMAAVRDGVQPVDQAA